VTGHPQYDGTEPAPEDPVEPGVYAVRDPRVAAAVARLDGLADLPPVEHVEVYEDVHRVLQESLADAARTSAGSDPGEAEAGPGGARP
jgi:hypothetical protein